MSKGRNLREAQRNKNDEYYTLYKDIEDGIGRFIDFNSDVFKDKVIYLPCDDYDWSNFTKYFVDNFDRFGIKKLISTCYTPPSEEFGILPSQGKVFIKERGSSDIFTGQLRGDGDYRNGEMLDYRNESDIIITNPPFSLFRDFVDWIGGKQFIIVGHITAVAYGSIFPLIKDGKMTTFGYFSKFKSGDDIKEVSSYWYTNMDCYKKTYEKVEFLTMEENLRCLKNDKLRDYLYKKYDNYDAIEVSKLELIPSDYKGVMGVPITFLHRYANLGLFNIIGFRYGLDGDDVKIGNKEFFARVFIQYL